MALQPHRSSLKPWLWTAFLASGAACIIFAVLTGYTYKAFTKTVNSALMATPPGSMSPLVWQQVLSSCATSASFGLAVVVVYLVQGLVLLLCSTKALSHDDRRFGRGCLSAASIWAGLQILNIALQFNSISSAMVSLQAQYSVPFKAPLATTAYAFGIMAFLLSTAVSFLLLFWRDLPSTWQLEPAGASERDRSISLPVSQRV